MSCEPLITSAGGRVWPNGKPVECRWPKCGCGKAGCEPPLHPALNPWHPITSPVDLKHLGKLGEELGECSAAVARCVIQGIDEAEPTTGKINREWLEDELADVAANALLVIERFGLDQQRMQERAERKAAQLRTWHDMA